MSEIYENRKSAIQSAIDSAERNIKSARESILFDLNHKLGMHVANVIYPNIRSIAHCNYLHIYDRFVDEDYFKFNNKLSLDEITKIQTDYSKRIFITLNERHFHTGQIKFQQVNDLVEADDLYLEYILGTENPIFEVKLKENIYERLVLQDFSLTTNPNYKVSIQSPNIENGSKELKFTTNEYFTMKGRKII